MLDVSGIPYHSAETRIEKFDDEAVVYCLQLKKAIYLNETASVIWELCSGSLTVADIVELLSQNYPEHVEEVRAHAVEAIESLWQEGAIGIKCSAKN